MTNEQQPMTVSSTSELAAIRQAVGAQLSAAGFGARPVNDAMVMTCELIVNALDHAGSQAEVSVDVHGDEAKVEVHDFSSEWPVVRTADPARIGGNGLRIVEALSDKWGAYSHPSGGKSVWFSLRH